MAPRLQVEQRAVIPGRIVALALLVLLVVATACGGPAPPETTLARGVVSAPESRAAEVGAAILRQGGNAVDAAVAVQFALCVTNGFGAGLGGGGFMLVHDPAAESNSVSTLDYREKAPAAATRDMFLDEDGQVIKDMGLYTPLASGVPGTVRGMAAAWDRYGSLPWSRLLEPAVKLARDGFVLDPWTADSVKKYSDKFAALPAHLLRHVEFDDYYRGKEGAVLRLPDLADTLERIAREGADEFYRGQTAELLVQEMERDGGLITAADLNAYQAVWREPVEISYRGYRVVSMPPPSSGGIALAEFLNMAETFPPQAMHSAAQIHLFAEIAKRVFADRAEHMGDPDFHHNPMAELTDKHYAQERASEVNRHGRSDPASIRAGEFPRHGAGGRETTHFSIVDDHGMAVANTTTLNTAYGSGVVVDGAGFLLNSQMDDFSAKPGVPNDYGVTGSQANEIAPGKRPLSSMTPTMVFEPTGALSLVLGSPGGPSIISTVAQVIVHVVDGHQGLKAAVDLPRFHHQWPPSPEGEDLLLVESQPEYALPQDVLAELSRLGYTIKPRKTLGDVQAVMIQDGVATGVFDRRRTGGVAYP
ncbi:MAG: gamma-glutamyltransferase [Acidobacteria bacterium]|nr:gamma-glutamyltransferase [Acidobacteriota bacterium]